MKQVPYRRPHRAGNPGSTFGKVVGTIASLLTIAAILFVGSRDWKAHQSIPATLLDISDIRGVLSKIEHAGSTVTAKSAALHSTSNEVERSLIEKGTLVRRTTQIASDTPGAPTGLMRETATAY